MSLFTGLVILALGIVVWLFGNRMWLLGAGAGALLGAALLHWFSFLSTGLLGLFIVVGMAVLFGVLGFFGKAFAKIIAMVIGFIAGGAVTIGFLDVLGFNSLFMAWIFALVGALIGAVLFARFLNWGLIIFASLLGSLLIVNGAIGAFFPAFVGAIGTLLVLVLTGAGIFYHYRQQKGKV